ncbi:MAG TPA: hypothetical protein VMI73_21060 [Trebonia sp.]|nr:hypothetical protein [Trebonia sp.]
MLAHAQSGDAAFTACLKLFRGYPLAVRRHYAEHRYGSMVLKSRRDGTARFYVLIMEWDDLFIIRPWDRRDGRRVEIRPHEPAPDGVGLLIESCVPVPRDGALLGWVVGTKVQALVAAHGRLPEPWDDPSVVPEALVLPLAGSEPAQWPPLPADPLDDGRLWELTGRGQLADLGPLVTRRQGRVFWVPADGGGARHFSGGRIVVTERMSAEDYWLLAGVYADQWMLREGLPVPSARQLLASPGVLDMARGQHLLGV